MEDFTFFCRNEELKKLNTLFEKCERGQLSVAMITGESGSGKTALATEFIKRIKQQNPGVRYAYGFCNSHFGQGEPYLPFRHAMNNFFEQLEPVATEQKSSTAGTIAKGIFKSLLSCAPDIIENFVPGGAIISKLGQSIAEEFPLKKKENDTSAASEKKEIQEGKIFEQYTSFLKTLGTEKPFVLIIDDMQWCDGPSANLLFHLVKALEKSGVLIICIYRSAVVALGRGGERHPLESVLNEIKRIFGNVWVDMDLSTKEERASFVRALVDADPHQLSNSFHDSLLHHTEGHALFASELLKSLKENGSLIKNHEGKWIETEQLDWRKNPEKMEGVVESRLGILEKSLKDILSIASVQGPQFVLQVITRLQQLNERESLQSWGRELSKKHQLITEEKTVRNGTNIVSFFRFSSSMFQQYLYNEMGEGERMLLHGDVAGVLEELYKGKEDEIIFELARHYDLALMPEKAAPCLLKAGQKALLLSAYKEARVYLQRASELCEQLPEDDETRKLKAEIWIYLSQTVRVLEGWSSPAAKELYEKVLEYCDSAEEKDKLLDVLFGLWTIDLVNADVVKALETARSMQEPAAELNEPLTEIKALIALGNTLFWYGDFPAIDSISEQLKKDISTSDSKTFLAKNGYEATAIANQFGSWSFTLQNKISEAEALFAASVKQAELSKHIFSQAIVYTTGAFLYAFIKQTEKVLEYSDKLISVSEKNNFESYRGLGMITKNWALIMCEQGGETAQIKEGFRLWKENSGKLVFTFKSLLLAEALIKTEKTDEAIAEINEALSEIENTSERALLCPLLNLKAKTEKDPAEKEKLLRMALDTALSQNALLFKKESLHLLIELLKSANRSAEAGDLESQLQNIN